VEDVDFYDRVVNFFLKDPEILGLYMKNPQSFVDKLRSGKYQPAIL